MNFVLSLGGSVINPGRVQTVFLSEFSKFIGARVGRGDKFYIITGGGALARQYQDAAKSAASVSEKDLDWLGIAPTKINAEIVRVLLAKSAYKEVLSDPRVKKTNRVVVYSGWKPGWSTDYVAVKVAQTYGVNTVINLSNVDYVYSADPRRDKRAKKMEVMSHSRFLKLIGKKRKPGGNYPFDPVAARLAQKEKIKIVVMNGRKLKNLENYLNKNKFQGTEIK